MDQRTVAKRLRELASADAAAVTQRYFKYTTGDKFPEAERQKWLKV